MIARSHSRRDRMSSMFATTSTTCQAITRSRFRSSARKLQRVNLDAQAGRVYRVKLNLDDDPWRGWIIDVTALEAGLPEHQPQINKRKKKSVPEPNASRWPC